MKDKIPTLIDICSKFNYNLILSGSFADYFWLNYQDVEDFDFIVDYAFFNDFIQQNTEIMKDFFERYALKHRIENKRLSRYFYSGYQVDIFAQEIVQKNEVVMLDKHPILVTPPDIRLNNLINHKYVKSKMPEEVYDRKIKKVNERIESYKKLLS
jgi:hypothetical protein